ncbi:MAG: hypothetical protein ACXVZH_03525 [Terriglobales bacterium]
MPLLAAEAGIRWQFKMLHEAKKAAIETRSQTHKTITVRFIRVQFIRMKPQTMLLVI